MKWVVWQKVTGNSKFAEMLKAVPRTAMIVGNASCQHGDRRQWFWGAKNFELKGCRELTERAVECRCLDKTQKETEAMKQVERNKINHVGQWVGNNCMGNILKQTQLCILDGRTPQIDLDLLRSKDIHLFGQRLCFAQQDLLMTRRKEMVPTSYVIIRCFSTVL